MKIKTSTFQSAQQATKSLLDFIREEDFTVQLVAVPQILFQGEPAETILHLTSEEIYDIPCTKTFTIQIKRSFAKGMDGTPGKLIVLSYMEKENVISASLSPSPMDTTGSNKRKNVDPTTSHHKHISEAKTAPPKHYNK
ncbi:hypothetical protein H5410_036214, partial [Solanum commersonii]